MTARLEQELRVIATAWEAEGQPQATFEAVGAALQRCIGHRLYTITHILPGGREVERLHSTDPAAYAVGGRKPIVASAHRDRLFAERRPFLGRRPADFAAYFPDHAFIVSLGLGSVINAPLIFAGAPLGSVNILDREGAYEEGHLDVAAALARMIVPALLGRSLAAIS
jgi:hypothetical protein